jgi:hypothetical protein
MRLVFSIKLSSDFWSFSQLKVIGSSPWAEHSRLTRSPPFTFMSPLDCLVSTRGPPGKQKIQEIFQFSDKEHVFSEQMDYHYFLWIMDFVCILYSWLHHLTPNYRWIQLNCSPVLTPVSGAIFTLYSKRCGDFYLFSHRYTNDFITTCSLLC